MAEKTVAVWKLALGYTAFAIASLVAGLLLTFPYDALEDRVRSAADRAGYRLDLGSLGPGLLSVRATKVELRRKGDGTGEQQPLRLDSVSVSPTLFPPGLSVTAKALGGSLTARGGGLGAVRVRVDAEDLDLSKGNVKGFTGMDLSGTVEAHLDLSMPMVPSGSGPSEPDLGAASGTVRLETHGVAVNGGSLRLPDYEQDLPKIVLGDLTGSLKFEKGAGTIEDFKSRSADFELQASGTAKLNRRVEYSELNLEVRFKPEADFQKRLGMVSMGLASVPSDPKDPSWRMVRITGDLGRPAFPNLPRFR